MIDGKKKHPCPDCRSCQQCGDARCHACRSGHARPPRLTFAEQIALFNARNQDDEGRPDQPWRPFGG
jgi:hypothetical protein